MCCYRVQNLKIGEVKIMATVKLRGNMAKGHKIFGSDFGDRVIIGRSVFANSMQPLPAEDKRRTLKLQEYECRKSTFGTPGGNNNIMASLCLKAGAAAADRHTPPLFYSSQLSCIRDCPTMPDAINFPIGAFKGPGVVFTVDGTGIGSDFLAPGMRLHISTGGLVHTCAVDGEITPLMYPDSPTLDTTYSAPGTTSTGYILRNMPMILGHSLISYFGSVSDPNAIAYNGGTIAVNSAMATALRIRFTKIIGQDATYIYTAQLYNTFTSQYTYNSATPLASMFMAVRKSDGAQFMIATVAAVHAAQGVCGHIFQSLTTVEATPKKAVLYLGIGRQKTTNSICLSKLIDKTMTSLGVFDISSLMGSGSANYHCSQPTQFMPMLMPSYPDYLKSYIPSFTGNSYPEGSGFILLRQKKDLTTAPTAVKCTISGLPAEYASPLGTTLKAINTATSMNADIIYAAEILDGAKQYIAAWIGITRSPTFQSASFVDDTNAFMTTDAIRYRYFVVLEVDPTDDSKLIYRGDIPSFKNAKPMYLHAASPDNKQICVANVDGLYCYNWSTAAQNFVHVDTVALPNLFSIGMPETISADKQSVWVESLQTAGVFDYCDSDVYQITFGDYIDADLQFWDTTKSAFAADYTLSSLPVSKTGLVYDAKTMTVQCRVKTKISGVETAFATGKTVRLRINGVREVDGVSFVGCDSGQPWLKTITSTSEWQDAVVNYSNPVNGLWISAEVLP